MRALLGPLNPAAHRPVVGDLDGLDARCFDASGADIAFDASREPIEALWQRLPAGWAPDCLIWWSPEYSLVPEGIERCPVPSIAVLGDWNLGVWTTAPLLEAFDWVVTDRLGVARLGPQLAVPVDPWPAFSFDPGLHRRRPDARRDIDVLFVGNMNPDVQVDRARWLARLARLADRHRVVVASGVYGAPYAELLNRARIVWNRSIRGELNMRAYEAPACGALLLMEEDNLEVRDVFTPDVSCALYGADSLESTLDAYLARPARLAQVADAGWRRVQSETYRAHIERLLGDARRLAVGPRPFGRLAPWRRDFWLGVHALCCADPARIPTAIAHLTRALDRSPDRAAVAAILGAVSVMAAVDGPADERGGWAATAASCFAAALAADPADVITRMNLAWILAAGGDTGRARTEWLAARAHLQSGAPIPVDRVPVPFSYDRFRTEWERASVAAAIEDRMAGFRPLLEARVAAELAGIDRDGDGPVTWWTESVEAWPGIAGNVRRLAQALEVAGHGAAAAAGYASALDANPFDWQARASAAALAARRQDATRLAGLIAEGRRLAAIAPECAERAASLAALAGDGLAVRLPS